MNPALLLLLLLEGSLASLGMTEESAAAPSGLVNAQVTVRRVSAAGLAGDLRSVAKTASRAWIGYEQEVLDGDRQMCCFGSLHAFKQRRGERICCGGCRLEEDDSYSINRNDESPVPPERRSQFLVLVRVERGQVDKVRALSPDCGLDAGGLPVVWLTGVSARDSLTVLASLVPKFGETERGGDPAGGTLAAIALHADPFADSILEGLTRRDRPVELRKKAAFWLGNERGRRGFEILRELAADPDPEFRSHLTFCLSQSPVPEAVSRLTEMARTDRDGGVRAQALFWLAQKAADKAAETIQNAIRNDPDEEVKKKAVFALSQLKGDEAVTQLIRVARTNRNPEVRKQAIFWLGQSRDPRALAFIEEILSQ